ncbi:hypothetical protein, partial [Bradyrhizobium sp.]|uniref:hypothetical protein n=1 Tax=Bradyrhizobium sp. TaxID=376 RepID=UPI00391DEB81
MMAMSTPATANAAASQTGASSPATVQGSKRAAAEDDGMPCGSGDEPKLGDGASMSGRGHLELRRDQ